MLPATPQMADVSLVNVTPNVTNFSTKMGSLYIRNAGPDDVTFIYTDMLAAYRLKGNATFNIEDTYFTSLTITKVAGGAGSAFVSFIAVPRGM